ncbi:MAG: hypothetical protein A4E65_00194 [Syntrophorhabdus sp. PtaU1.Bin153]|nr:MAG: hypothetical protein A4E65_00194 [Syntrophorhabdus sp. PtaU1.Bin153]
MKILRNGSYALCIMMFVCLLTAYEVVAAQDGRFVCGGSVETEVWTLWDTNVRDFFKQRFLEDRLLKQGDVYALYDFQTYTHNMVSMARRCNRTARLMEVARMINTAYRALERGGQSSPGRRWVCRGGSTCNEKNRLLNQEVMLDSVQFLGLASSVANALATSGTPLGDEDKIFIKDTVQIVVEHLVRWGDGAALSEISKLVAATPQDVKNGSSALFFTDKPLWMITIYAELAGILNAQERWRATDPSLNKVFTEVIGILRSQGRQQLGFDGLTDENKARLRLHLSTLLQFFSARISIQRNANSRMGNVDLADLDRGYWRLFPGNEYAGYEGEPKPVVCSRSKDGKTKVTTDVRVSADAVPKRQDIGWDISHARRLVHALDALERNRDAMKDKFSLNDGQLPSIGLPSAFANTLVAVVWNGDTTKPLFSNYWSGANGWYRVEYDDRTGQCREGYPPYGLTDSFPTGGYSTWARYRPVIGALGQRLYDLISAPDGASSPFIAKYYPSLSKSANVQSKKATKFMFLPSLVGVVKE